MPLSDIPPEVVVVFVVRVCLGLFFLPSAAAKLANLQEFIEGTIDYHILPEWIARIFGFMIPWVELGLAFALLTGIALPLVGIGVVLLLLSFITAIVVNLQRGRAIACSCYGLGSTRTIGWGSVTRNVLLLLLAIPIIWLAPVVWSLSQWHNLWLTQLTVLSSITSTILFVLLIGFCYMVIYLGEWAVDIHYRVSQIKFPSN